MKIKVILNRLLIVTLLILCFGLTTSIAEAITVDTYFSIEQYGENAIFGGATGYGQIQCNSYPLTVYQYWAPPGEVFGRISLSSLIVSKSGFGYVDYYQNGVWSQNWQHIGSSTSTQFDYDWPLPPNVTAVRISTPGTGYESYIKWRINLYYGNNLRKNVDDVKNITVQARDFANAANTAATNAQTAAQAASNQTWYSGKYGGSSESTADITGYIRML